MPSHDAVITLAFIFLPYTIKHGQLPAHPCQPLTLKASSTARAEDTATSLSDFSCEPSPQFMITFKWSLDKLEKRFHSFTATGCLKPVLGLMKWLTMVN